jgi:hypothetical protein
VVFVFRVEVTVVVSVPREESTIDVLMTTKFEGAKPADLADSAAPL